MSHVTVMKGIVINDVAAFKSALAELIANGLRAELAENTTVRGHYSGDTQQMGTCDFVIKLKDAAYDVGFKRNAKGEYEPVFDVYGQHVGRQLGANATCDVPSGHEGDALRQLGKFSQTYAKFAAMNEAANLGYSIESCQIDAQGNLQLLLNA